MTANRLSPSASRVGGVLDLRLESSAERENAFCLALNGAGLIYRAAAQPVDIRAAVRQHPLIDGLVSMSKFGRCLMNGAVAIYRRGVSRQPLFPKTTHQRTMR